MTKVTRNPDFPPMRGPGYKNLKEFVIKTTGMVFYADKDEELIKILNSRLAALDINSYDEYLEIIRDPGGNCSEIDDLIAELTIGETYFFRHSEQFEAIRKIILPQIIKKNRASKRIKIWSAGCSIGAEPYSISIIIQNEFARQTTGWTIDIIGTDINKKFLAMAKSGSFSDWALRATPDEAKNTCFDHSGRKWLLKPRYKAPVSLQYHNLVENPFPSHLDGIFAFDLIICRNVTIYFNRDIIRSIIAGFHGSLVDDGWLVVGHSEPDMEMFNAFQTVNAPGTVIYRKTDLADDDYFKLKPNSVPDPDHTPPVATATAKINRITRPHVTTAATSPAKPSAEENTGLDMEHVRSLADHGKLKEAARCCKKLIGSDNLNPALYLLHALVLEQTGDNVQAEEALRKAIYLDRSYVLPHYHLGLFLSNRGDYEAARRSFANALKLLARLDTSSVFEEADGITAGQLANLANIHMQVIDNLQ